MFLFINKSNRNMEYWGKILKSEEWNKYSLLKRKNIIKEIYNTLKEDIDNIAKGIIFYKNEENNNYLGQYARAYYSSIDHNIHINETYLIKSIEGFVYYNSIAHELYHSYQQISLDKYNSIISNNKNLNKYGINNLYIYAEPSLNRNIANISNIFYYLNKYEREAFIYGDNVENTLTNKMRFIPDVIELFKTIYKCQNLSDRESYNLIDACFDKVYDNQLPKDNLEATIMYDIYVLAMYQSNSIDKNDLIRLLNYTNKAKILEEKEFEIYSSEFIPSNSLKDKCKDIRNNKENSLSLLKSLNDIQVRNNPDFINMMLHFYKKESTDILKYKGVPIEDFINNNDKEEIEFDKT